MLSLENAAALILHAGLVMYALFGGADFGGGIWTAFASGPRAREQRDSLFLAIGPVWETNHIWIIFMVVTLFTAFPTAFSLLFTYLLVPFAIALVGINFRGAAFAFRHFGKEIGDDVPLAGRAFEIASILTPFALGMAVTAVASGRIELAGGGVTLTRWGWISPFTITGGFVGMAVCAYLAPIYMTVRTAGELREDFRQRGIAAGLALGLLTTAAIPVAMADAPLFAQRLLRSWPLFLVSVAVVCGIATQFLLWRRNFLAAQLMAAATVTFTISGYSAALYPDIIIGQLTIAAAAAPHPTLIAYLTVLPVGALILVPSLVYLYRTFGTEALGTRL